MTFAWRRPRIALVWLLMGGLAACTEAAPAAARLPFVTATAGATSAGSPTARPSSSAAGAPSPTTIGASALTSTARSATPAATPRPPAAAATVFVIVLENQNWSAIAGNPAAPYLNQTLAPLASRAAQYSTPPGNHPSEPNYLWLEAGSNFGIADDGPPNLNHQQTNRHLVSLLRAAGISWKAYQEGIDGSSCPLQDVGPYATKHDPFVYFDDVTDGGRPDSPYCLAHIRPFGELASDLGRGNAARYNFITPDLCDDMHDACPPTSDRIAQGDHWLASTVPAILDSAAYKAGGVLFIAWDEGSGDGDGPLGLLVLSPLVKGHGFVGTTHYTHSATLRTIQELLGVGPLLGGAATSLDLGDLFSSPLPPAP